MSATEAQEHVPFIDYENLPAPTEGIRRHPCSSPYEAWLGPGRSTPRSSAARWCLRRTRASSSSPTHGCSMNPGGPPTPDKPDISVVNYEPGNTVSSFMNLRVADIQACYEQWKSKGAEFVTPPIDRAC